MKKYIIGIMIFVVTLVSFALNFTVYPTRFNIDSSRVTTEELTIINNTLEPLRVEIYPEADKSFSETHNLNENIKLFPKNISIKPGASQVVRFRVKPEAKLRDGEYRSYITFKEIPYEIKTTVQDKESGEGITSNLKFITQISIPVLSMGSNIVLDGELKNLSYNYNGKELIVNCDINSKGNAAIYYYYDLKISGEEEIANGRLGYSKRTGASKISTGINLKGGLKGREAIFRIYDQTGKEYFNKNIKL